MIKYTKFQRRHYELMAETLAYSTATEDVIQAISDMFARDNSRFNEHQFKNRIRQFKEGLCVR